MSFFSSTSYITFLMFKTLVYLKKRVECKRKIEHTLERFSNLDGTRVQVLDASYFYNTGVVD